MTAGRDDDALSWEGDDDPTLAVQPAPVSEQHAAEPAGSALPDGFNAVGKGSDGVGRIDRDGTVTTPGQRAPLGNGALVTIGVLAGVYLLYTVGWLIGGLRLQAVALGAIDPWMYRPTFVLAVLAPLIWLGSVLVLTRRSSTWVRLLWLFAGAVLLLPWPFVMVGAVGGL